MFGEFTPLKHLAEKVWRMNRPGKGLFVETTTLDGFSLANHRQFAKFAKLSTRQTFPLYGICMPKYHVDLQLLLHSTVSLMLD